MPDIVHSDTDNYRHLFLDDVPMIDTRAPVEYTRGAFEHAVNMPLMTDEERHQVGVRYKEAGQEAAMDLGRELVGPTQQEARTQQWVSFAKQYPNGYLYCFRGGLRSRITQTWMSEAGVQYPRIQGGYKAMRNFLLKELTRLGEQVPMIVISGRTGTGKTRLLNRIRRSLDLEGLANHRGSSFGPMAKAQPTPINFENQLAVQMLKLTRNDETSAIFVEGEGKLVGSLAVPKSIWDNMQRSPVLVLEADMDTRVDIGVSDYVIKLLNQIQQHKPGEAGFEHFAERHRQSLYRIRRRLGLECYDHASSMLETAFAAHHDHDDVEGYREFIRLLLERYYDPMYDYQLSRRQGEVLAKGDESDLLSWLGDRGVEMVE